MATALLLLLSRTRDEHRHNGYDNYNEREHRQPPKPEMACTDAEQRCGGHANNEVTETSSRKFEGKFSKCDALNDTESFLSRSISQRTIPSTELFDVRFQQDEPHGHL